MRFGKSRYTETMKPWAILLGIIIGLIILALVIAGDTASAQRI